MPDIKVKGWSGADFEHKDVPLIWLADPSQEIGELEEGETPALIPFTYGQAVSKTVEPDFSGGDMAVEIPEGELVTGLTITKPSDLVPEKIAEGEYIAGVGPGTFAGAVTEEIEVELSLADGNQIVLPSAEDRVLSKVIIKKPATLVPENIVEDVDIAGVKGSAATSAQQGALVYSKVKYFNYYPTSAYQSTELVSAAELAACGIDLTQYNQWYKDGHVYVPFIRIAKLMDADKTYPTSYRCIVEAWASNMKIKPYSGSWYNIGGVIYCNESGLDACSVMRLSRKSEGLPFTNYSSGGYTGDLFYLHRNKSIYMKTYYSSSVRYMLSGKYLITVMLIPTS